MRTYILTFLVAASLSVSGAESEVEFHIAPQGADNNPGTANRPFATLQRARDAARPLAGTKPIHIYLQTGTYYLPETLRLGPLDSGTAAAPIKYSAAPGAKPVLSGGVLLKPEWSPFTNGIYRTSVPPGLVIDQLFLNGERLPMARYPNYDPDVRQFNGFAADAIAPARVARWADPAGGYIHAMHEALWGDMHWRILGKKADGSLNFEGGWQNNRPSPMHKDFRFVENIFEELDAPGEWFHDARQNLLYMMPPRGADLVTARVEIVRLRHLVEFSGTREHPVRFITLRGLTFRHAARTFMDNREPLLRSDWTVYRGGAVMFNNAEDATLEDCDFDQVGGNTVFVNNYNRRITIRGCLMRESGANGVAFVGDPQAVRSPLFNYGQPFDYAKIDRTPGPQTDNFPADCLVEDCLITHSGRCEKQTAPVQISMSQNITVRHCSIYDVPRAGINIGDGCWGGHVIEGCDVFDTVLETGDHGSFNSWGRDRYWHPDVRTVDKQVALDPALPFLDVVRPVFLRHNRWRCDHGWDVDLDDGSSHFVISDNLLLQGGLKMREGYQRIATNNVIVANSLHPHVWFARSGDVFARNIVMGHYQPAIMDIPKWGREIDWNLFATSEADRTKFAAQGCDSHSVVGDPLFVDPARGDFRVREGSPALKLGFRNFAMDQFGVTSPRLRAIARTPAFPAVSTLEALEAAAPTEVRFAGALLRSLFHYEFSALGVAADSGGAFVAEVAADSHASRLGVRKGDLIQKLNGRVIKTPSDLVKEMDKVIPGQPATLSIIRNQQSMDLRISPPQ